MGDGRTAEDRGGPQYHHRHGSGGHNNTPTTPANNHQHSHHANGDVRLPLVAAVVNSGDYGPHQTDLPEGMTPSWDDWKQDWDEDQQSTVYNEAGQGRLTLAIAVTAFVSALGASFPHGWNTGVLNAPTQLIKAFLNETATIRSGGTPPTEGLLNLLWALSVAIYLVGGCGGAFAAGSFADKFGRKKAILICSIFNFIGAILFGLCKVAQSLEMLIIARFFVGFGCGAGSGLVPMYLTEIAPVNFRGAMGVLHQFALTCGILVSQVIGIRQILGSESLWPFLLALTALPCIPSLLILPFYPESPRYLYVNQQDEKAAERALKIFRGTDDVYMDMEEMRAEAEQQRSEPQWTFKQLLSSRALRMPLIIVSILTMCQQLSGINVVFYYSTDVFISAGIPMDKTQYAVIGTGIINVLMTGISVPLMEKSGRRPLLLGGMFVMLLSAITITVALNLQEAYRWMAYVSFVCVITFVIGFAIGLGSIPQFIGAEIFKQGPRPPAMSIAGFLNWLCNFLVAILYPFIEQAIGPYSFLIFIGFLVTFGGFLYWKLPETKKKTYEEIAQMFRKGDPETHKSRELGSPEGEHLMHQSYTAPNMVNSPSNLTESTFVSNGGARSPTSNKV